MLFPREANLPSVPPGPPAGANLRRKVKSSRLPGGGGCLAEFWATYCERPWQRVAGGRSHRHVSRIHDVLWLALNDTCAPWKLAITMRIADALIALMSP